MIADATLLKFGEVLQDIHDEDGGNKYFATSWIGFMLMLMAIQNEGYKDLRGEKQDDLQVALCCYIGFIRTIQNALNSNKDRNDVYLNLDADQEEWIVDRGFNRHEVQHAINHMNDVLLLIMEDNNLQMKDL